MGLTTSGATSSGGSAQTLRKRGNIFCEVRDEGVQDGGRAPSGNRVSVYEAAKVLGITVGAIRKRIQRGTIRHERDDNSRVWLPARSGSKPRPESRHLESPPPAKVQGDSEGRDESRRRRLFLG
jgi:hypothetical protein